MAKNSTPAAPAADAPAAAPVKIPVRKREDSKQAWTHEGQPVPAGEVREVWPDQADRLIKAGVCELA